MTTTAATATAMAYVMLLLTLSTCFRAVCVLGVSPPQSSLPARRQQQGSAIIKEQGDARDANVVVVDDDDMNSAISFIERKLARIISNSSNRSLTKAIHEADSVMAQVLMAIRIPDIHSLDGQLRLVRPEGDFTWAENKGMSECFSFAWIRLLANW